MVRSAGQFPALLTLGDDAAKVLRMIKSNLVPARLQLFCAAAIASALLVSAGQALAAGEAPAGATVPDDGLVKPLQGKRSKSAETLLTVGNRQIILAELYDQLAKAEAPETAAPLVDAIWKVWTFSGSPTSDLLMERARGFAMEPGGAASQAFLDAVVELQPDFAQGWFLRAMVYKAQGDSHRMLGDLRRTLALDPRHFEAMKALAFELNELGRKMQAIEAYGKLLKIYPAAAKSEDRVLQALERALGGTAL